MDDLSTKVESTGMSSYSFSAASNISYGDMQFKSFGVREVHVNGRQKGEFHIKPMGNKLPASAVLFLKPHFPDCSIGLADPSELLNLEYPIYLVCNAGSMIMESIPRIFEKIDEEIDSGTIP